MTTYAPLPKLLVERLAQIKSVGAVTGAGISAESGIPTYRGQGGIYDDPETGDRTIDALTGETLRSDPDRTWRTILELVDKAKDARPNPGHDALAAIEQRVERFVLLTQNVDGLHEAAGSKNIIDIHGTISNTICMSCGEHSRLEAFGELTGAPRCKKCDGVMRPDAVLFGEMLPMQKVARLRKEFYSKIPELVLVAGTTAMFPYIAEPVVVAQQAGRLTVEVNPEETVLSAVVDFSLRGPAGHYLPKIAEVVGGRRCRDSQR